MKDIWINGDRCGSGKTEWAVKKMATPARWMYAVDRIDVFEARKAWIECEAAANGRTVLVVKLHSQKAEEDGEEGKRHTGVSLPVKQEIAWAARDYDHLEHVVIMVTHEMVTHEGLKGAEFSRYEGGGWRLIIDEIPTAWSGDSNQTPAMVSHFKGNYDLVPVGYGWSMATAKPDAVTVSDYMRDDTLRPWLPFHQRVMSKHGVLCDLKEWEEMADSRSWMWWSLWNPAELSAFDQVYMIGHAITEMVTFKLLQRFHGSDLNFVPFPIGASDKVWQPRTVTIRYFSKTHTGGSYFWQNEDGDGPECTDLWHDWIKANSVPHNHFWAKNNVLLPRARIPGEKVSIKIAGSNDYREITCCSVIYSAKFHPENDRPLEQFGISKEDVIRSREYEDLIQFVLICVRVGGHPK